MAGFGPRYQSFSPGIPRYLVRDGDQQAQSLGILGSVRTAPCLSDMSTPGRVAPVNRLNCVFGSLEAFLVPASASRRLV